MKPSTGYLIYQDETLLAVYGRRLEVRKIVAVIMALGLVLSLLVWPLAEGLGVDLVRCMVGGSACWSLWNVVLIVRLTRRIRALKGGRR